jgi:type II secretory pathway pseudopilin PulG
MTPRVFSSSQAGSRRLPCTAAGRRHFADHLAFTLIEVIGVLGIIAILVAATLPVVIRQIDYTNEAVEGTNLLALATGLTQGASAQRNIPSQAGWATFIATNIGWQATAVSNIVNNPQNPRLFLINPALQIGTNYATNLPYLQTSNGSPTIPAYPQFIIISSLSSSLANAGLNSGVPTTNDFNALWNTPANTIPTNTGSTVNWNNWHGQGADITIQDINLASSFNHLTLSVDPATPTNAPYSIDSYGVAFVTTNTPVTNYFLKGTVFNLYYYTTNNTTNLQASQVLQQDSSWVFSGGLWRNAAVAASGSGGSGTYGSLQAIVQSFVTNSAPPGATITPSQFYSDMTNFMSNYIIYANSGFNANTPAHLELQALANSAGAPAGGVIQNDLSNLK